MIRSTLKQKQYTVNLDEKPYTLLLGNGILTSAIIEVLNSKSNNKNIVVVFDTIFEKVIVDSLKKQLIKAGYVVYTHPLEAGKQNKTISEAMKIYDLLESNNLSRDSTIIAVGGGVIGDLVGFVASTYLRGMNLIHVPTTMTAMIDSSIGGKVAINFRKTINAIGNYYHPILNVIDLGFLKTLPMRELKSGLAEIIKCAIIADKELFTFFENKSNVIIERREEALLSVMSRAIEIKLEHVAGDVREQAKRLKLNYGHTLGHAIETSTGMLGEVYRHGEGVALGMVGAAYIACKHFGLDNQILKYHEDILRLYGLPVRVDAPGFGFDRLILIEDCMANVNKDKKRKDGKLRFILPRQIGSCEVCSDIPDSLIKEAFYYVIGGKE